MTNQLRNAFDTLRPRRLREELVYPNVEDAFSKRRWACVRFQTTPGVPEERRGTRGITDRFRSHRPRLFIRKSLEVDPSLPYISLINPPAGAGMSAPAGRLCYIYAFTPGGPRPRAGAAPRPAPPPP
ncbi:hypothetical protein EVAR_16622_1 [Eumeta japonica]|uniref:Uncharacterized protein n=1 Tax=Eumeta variegata TaxID=151549 RepID=A0A4C1UZE3_EUMVA|nr:hypothetical protein EVAR_16622_1 [Eumeta japonica]